MFKCIVNVTIKKIYLTKISPKKILKQSGNETWSVNRTSQKEITFFKNYAENEVGKLVPDSFFL